MSDHLVKPPHEPIRIGFLAKRELTRLIETDKTLALDILYRAESIVSENGYLITGYSRTHDGKISGSADPSYTNYQFANILGRVSLRIIPPGPIQISETEIWFKMSDMPKTAVADIRATAVGSKLSKYVSFADFDIDEIYPGGITRISQLGDSQYLIIEFDRVTSLFDEFAASLRARSKEVSAQD